MVRNEAEYSLEGNVLKVKGKLAHSEEETFRSEAGRLQDCGSGEVLIDLSEVTFIASACLGTLIFLNDSFAKQGITLRLRLPKILLYVCDLMGVRDLIQTELVE